MASDLTAADTAILDRLEAAWADRTPVAWPREVFEPPTGEPVQQYWIQPMVIWGKTVPLSIGSTGGRNQTPGVISINVFGPKGYGNATLLGHADALRDIFNRVEFSGVRCWVASGPTPVPDEEWEQVNISIPFTCEEVLT